MLLLFALYIACSRKSKNVSLKSVEATQSYEIKVASSMEAGEPVKAVTSVEEDDKNSESTICPSPSNDDRQSDIQSQQSLCVAACKGSKAIRRSPSKFDSDGLESPRTK